MTNETTGAPGEPPLRPPWRPKYVTGSTVGSADGTSHPVVHIHMPSGRSLCELAASSDSRRPGRGEIEETTACGPCILAAAALSNMASQILDATAAPRSAPDEAARALAESPFGHLFGGARIVEWAQGGNAVAVEPHDPGPWAPFVGRF